MNYKIEIVKEESNYFKEITGMKLLTYKSPVTNRKHIDGPINKVDYDKYYSWLRKDAIENNISISENLEDFKKEFATDPALFIPYSIGEDDLIEIRKATKNDIEQYNTQFENYFNL